MIMRSCNNGYICSERALTLYIVGVSLGGWQDMYTERLVDSVVGRTRVVMTCLVGCLWLLPPLLVAPSRGDTSASVYAAFLKGADVYA